MIRALTALGAAGARGSLAGWLLGTARRAVADIRSAAAREGALREALEQVRPVRTEAPSPDSLVDRLLVTDAMAGPRPEQRRAVGLAFDDGLTHAQRIADELGLAEPAPVVRAHRTTPWRRPLLVGGAALLAAAAAVVAVLGVRAALPSEESAPLAALGETDATGRVLLHARSLVVHTSGLPETEGFYEVWLLDLDRGRMVALGALDDTGRGRLAVPEGVRLGTTPRSTSAASPTTATPPTRGTASCGVSSRPEPPTRRRPRRSTGRARRRPR